MLVDVNNSFNTDEERIQYTLGTMDAYSINVERTVKPRGAACYPGIIALSHAEALIKFLRHCPKIAQDHTTLNVNLCE